MTPEHDQDDRLRAALARSVDGYAPSPAPVDRILAAGRTRRARRRRAAVVAAAASVLAVGLAVRPAWHGAGPERHVSPATGAPVPTAAPAPAGPQRAEVAGGTVDGTPWSVTLEYYATQPAGYRPGSGTDSAAEPPGSALLCHRMVVGGIRIDHQGGPWADCEGVAGPDDPRAGGEEGLWGLHGKGTTGSRLFVSNPDTGVAYGIVTLTDGTAMTAHVVSLPGTAFRAWAVAVPAGRTIAAVDQYDTGHHRLSHETDWR